MKYLKLFDSLDSKKIDTNILMDGLCQLKDGTYDVIINFFGSRLRDYFNNIVSVELIVNGLKEENANKYLDHVYQIAHQMLNNYYDETGNEVYLILYPSALDNWDEEHLLEFHLAPISEITKHHQVFWLMRKKDLYPNEVNPSYKSLSESVNSGPVSEIFTVDEIEDICEVFRNDIVDEYNLTLIKGYRLGSKDICYKINAWDGRGLFLGHNIDSIDRTYIMALQIVIHGLLNIDDLDKFKIDIDIFQKQLKNMGFSVSNNISTINGANGYSIHIARV